MRLRLRQMGRRSSSYNRERAIRARELARQTSVVEHRQRYLRLAFQYDAIADLEEAQPRLACLRRPSVAAERHLWQSLPNERSSSHQGL